MSNSQGKETNSKQIKQGCIHEEFKEVKEVKGIIDSIVGIYENDIAVEMAVERFQGKSLLKIDIYSYLYHSLVYINI